MSDRCFSCGDNLSVKGRGHVFACSHTLCIECLQVFEPHSFRSVCFSCTSPDPEKFRGDPMAKKTPTEAELIIAKTKEKPQTKNTEIFSKLIGENDFRVTSPDTGSTRGGVVQSFPVLERFLKSMDEKKTEIEKAEAAFLETVGEAREKIARHARMCRGLIDRDEDRLLRQLDDVKSTVLAESFVMLDGLKGLTERAKETLRRGKGGGHVAGEMEKLFSDRVAAAGVRFQEVDVELSRVMAEETENAVGKLSFKVIAENSSFLSSPVQIGTITGNPNPVSGIAVLDRKIFVTTEVDTSVSVFERSEATGCPRRLPSLSFLRLVQPIDVPAARDIGACRRNRCLYVLDSVNCHVYRLRPDDGQLLAWWPVKAAGVEGLSVTGSGTVLVAVEKKVVEFDPTGHLVRTITSPMFASIGPGFRAVFRLPRHAVELPDVTGSTSNTGSTSGTGSTISSTGSGAAVVVADFRENREHVVYVTDRSGGAPSGCHGNATPASGPDGFDEPRHLAVDPASGHVMVADRRNHRVVLLDRKLEFVRDLMTSSIAGVEVVKPVRLCLDPSRGLLYVGQANGLVAIYRVLL